MQAKGAVKSCGNGQWRAQITTVQGIFVYHQNRMFDDKKAAWEWLRKTLEGET